MLQKMKSSSVSYISSLTILCVFYLGAFKKSFKTNKSSLMMIMRTEGVWDKTYYHMTSNTYVSLVKNSIYSIYGQKWCQTASALFCIKSFTFSKIFFFWIETSDLHIIIDVDNDNANDLRLEIANHLRLGSRLILIRFYILFRG